MARTHSSRQQEARIDLPPSSDQLRPEESNEAKAAAARHAMRAIALYWEARKPEFLFEAECEFFDFVNPAFLYGEPPLLDPECLTALFTEWVLFDRPYHEGKTLVETYSARPPVDATPEQIRRARQIAETQLFTRFIIRHKNRASGMAVLEDIQTARRFDVYDPTLCACDRWRNGTIGERIACVDGLWSPIARICLYDRAAPQDTAVDGPGFFHPEDRIKRPEAEHATFYLRLVRDVIGIDGRYRHSATIPVDPSGATSEESIASPESTTPKMHRP